MQRDHTTFSVENRRAGRSGLCVCQIADYSVRYIADRVAHEAETLLLCLWVLQDVRRVTDLRGRRVVEPDNRPVWVHVLCLYDSPVVGLFAFDRIRVARQGGDWHARSA